MPVIVSNFMRYDPLDEDMMIMKNMGMDEIMQMHDMMIMDMVDMIRMDPTDITNHIFLWQHHFSKKKSSIVPISTGSYEL